MPNPMPSVVRIDPESEARSLARMDPEVRSLARWHRTQARLADEELYGFGDLTWDSSPLLDTAARELFGLPRQDESHADLRARLEASLILPAGQYDLDLVAARPTFWDRLMREDW